MVKELEDYAWFPSILRRWQMDFIGSVAQWAALYRPLVPVLRQLMQQNKVTQLTDCCSGSGIPAIYLHQRLPSGTTTLLTDLYPPTFTERPGIRYSPTPQDVRQWVPQPNQLYTMYNAFHHFTADEQKALLQNFAHSGAPFCIAEVLQPGPLNLLTILLTTTVGQVLAAPFIRPFSLGRLACTWLLPINLLTVTYDGIVSVLKSNTKKQYEQLMASIATPGYTFAVTVHRHLAGRIICITGQPLTCDN
jgi:hypothetical protein